MQREQQQQEQSNAQANTSAEQKIYKSSPLKSETANFQLVDSPQRHPSVPQVSTGMVYFKIVSHHKEDNHVIYVFEVCTLKANWFIKHRFNDFKVLHQMLSAKDHLSNLLPKFQHGLKSFFQSLKKEDKMNEKRKKYLVKYMNELGQSDVIYWDPSFQKFIELDVKMAKRIELTYKEYQGSMSSLTNSKLPLATVGRATSTTQLISLMPTDLYYENIDIGTPKEFADQPNSADDKTQNKMTQSKRQSKGIAVSKSFAELPKDNLQKVERILQDLEKSGCRDSTTLTAFWELCFSRSSVPDFTEDQIKRLFIGNRKTQKGLLDYMPNCQPNELVTIEMLKVLSDLLNYTKNVLAQRYKKVFLSIDVKTIKKCNFGRHLNSESTKQRALSIIDVYITQSKKRLQATDIIENEREAQIYISWKRSHSIGMGMAKAGLTKSNLSNNNRKTTSLVSFTSLQQVSDVNKKSGVFGSNRKSSCFASDRRNKSITSDASLSSPEPQQRKFITSNKKLKQKNLFVRSNSSDDNGKDHSNSMQSAQSPSKAVSMSHSDDQASDMQDEEVDQILFEESKVQKQFKPSVNLYVPLEAFQATQYQGREKKFSMIEDALEDTDAQESNVQGGQHAMEENKEFMKWGFDIESTVQKLIRDYSKGVSRIFNSLQIKQLQNYELLNHLVSFKFSDRQGDRSLQRFRETIECAIKGCCLDEFDFDVKAIKEINSNHRVVQIVAKQLTEPITMLLSYTVMDKSAYICFFDFDLKTSNISTNKFVIVQQEICNNLNVVQERPFEEDKESLSYQDNQLKFNQNNFNNSAYDEASQQFASQNKTATPQQVKSSSGSVETASCSQKGQDIAWVRTQGNFLVTTRVKHNNDHMKWLLTVLDNFSEL